MKKELKDYLPFYLGCQCRGWNFVIDDFGTWRKMTCSDLNLFLNHDVKCQIKLRPPASVTRDEVVNYILLTERYVPNSDGTYTIEQIEQVEYELKNKNGFKYRMTSNTFNYLTKQHFDLFGLIEAGLAIDSTTLNQLQ